MKSGMRPTKPHGYKSGKIQPPSFKPDKKGFTIKTGTSSYESRSIKPAKQPK